MVFLPLLLNTRVIEEGKRENGLVKEIKLILSWQQAVCVWVSGHHSIAHAYVKGMVWVGRYTLLLVWMQPSILTCQVGCLIYWFSLGLNRDSWRCRRHIIFALKSQMSDRPLQCSPWTRFMLLISCYWIDCVSCCFSLNNPLFFLSWLVVGKLEVVGIER